MILVAVGILWIAIYKAVYSYAKGISPEASYGTHISERCLHALRVDDGPIFWHVSLRDLTA